jgi:ATP-binding cassette, subfamily C, bacterial CydC
MRHSPLLRVVELARPLARRFGLAAALGATAIGASVALMGTSGYLISRAALRPPILSLEVTIVAVRAFGISRGVARYGERIFSHDATLRLLGRLRVTFYDRLEPLVPGGIGSSRAGDLLSGFVADVDALQNVFLRGIGPVIIAVAVSIGAAVAAGLFLLGAAVWLAAGLFLAALALPAAVSALARTFGRRQAPARGALATEVVELLSAAPELVAFEHEGAQLRRVEAADEQLRRLSRSGAFAAGLGEGGLTLLTGATALAVLLAGLEATRGGTLRGVLLAALVLLATASFEAVRPLPESAHELAAAGGAAKRLFELTDREPAVRDPRQPLSAPCGEELSFERVRARYSQGGPWVLDGVDLTLAAGRRVALVGPSGAGKSTLAALAVRFRDPDEGRVTLDGQDLRAYAQDDVRGAVVLSAQDAHLFSSTIRENLRLARPGAADEELVAAVRRAHAWDWVGSLARGLDTEVGELGAEVSGGQRQRIALARAYLSGARLLVLDEPTAHLDPGSAEAVMDDILDAPRDIGILVITHSPLRLERFDEVLRLDGGRIEAV